MSTSGSAARQRPTAVRQFPREQLVHIHLPCCLHGGIRVFGNFTLSAVQRQQRENRAVDALLGDLFEICQRFQQIEPSYAGRIFSNGGQRQHRAGILGVFALTEDSVLLPDSRFYIVIIGIVVFLRNLYTGACQPENQPVAANGTCPRLSHLRLQVAGRFSSCVSGFPAGGQGEQQGEQEKDTE